jgi:hypothetical protein
MKNNTISPKRAAVIAAFLLLLTGGFSACKKSEVQKTVTDQNGKPKKQMLFITSRPTATVQHSRHWLMAP